MRANIAKTFFIDQPIQLVWDNLSNPNEIVTCVPGAAITEQIDDRNFKGTVTMKFGPIKASYNGEIKIDKLDNDNYEMVMKGRGLDSKGKGSADMEMMGRLSEKDGGTEVEYNMEVSVIGMLAQFGSRLITDVSDQLANQFITNFKNKLAGGASEETTEAPADNSLNTASLMGNIVKNKISGIFGGKKDS
ncbi:MAG: SRPBCC family protein [Bacteroidota bacterium]